MDIADGAGLLESDGYNKAGNKAGTDAAVEGPPHDGPRSRRRGASGRQKTLPKVGSGAWFAQAFQVPGRRGVLCSGCGVPCPNNVLQEVATAPGKAPAMMQSEGKGVP